MSAASVTNPVISKLSVAMFEDSGWYTFNSGEKLHGNGATIAAEPLFWLKDYGCNIFTDSCPTASHTCESKGDYGCSYDNTFRGVCAVVGFANQCKYYVPYSPWQDYDCRVISEYRSSSQQLASRYWMSKGPNRRCFNGKINDTESGYVKTGNFCFKPRCDGNKLQFQFGTTWYTCSNNKQKISLTGSKTGYITCPNNVSRFCGRFNSSCSNDCMGRGRCMSNGNCYCYEGFSGSDCGNRVTLTETLINGSYQQSKIIKSGSCLNGGTYFTDIGYCMCQVGYHGENCETTDNLAKDYYTAPPGSLDSPDTGIFNESKGDSVPLNSEKIVGVSLIISGLVSLMM